MKKSLKAAILVGCVITGACSPLTLGPQNQAELARATFPGVARSASALGQGFLPDRSEPSGWQCVTGQIVEEKNSLAEATFVANADASTMLQDLAGSIDLGISFPLVSASGWGEYARKASANEFRETYTIKFKNSRRRILKPGSLTVAPEIAALPQNERERRCGGEFVQQIDLGLLFSGSLVIEYASREEKERLAGGIEVSVLGGVAQVSGSLEKISRLKQSRAKISLVAHQIGGEPLSLVETIGLKFAACDAEEPEACFEAFARLISYANGLGNQLPTTGSDHLEPLSYHTESYSESALLGFGSSSHPESEEIENTRSALSTARRRVNFATDRIRHIRFLTEQDAEASERSALLIALAAADGRLGQAIELCYGQEKSICVSGAEEAMKSIPAIPQKFLEVK